MHNENKAKIITTRQIIGPFGSSVNNASGDNTGKVVQNNSYYCMYVSLINTTLSGVQTIDGVIPSNGNKLLIANQTDAKQNGIYTYKSSGDWERLVGLFPGNQISILGGTKQGTIWVVETPSFVIGTDNISIIESAISRKDESFSLGFNAVTSLLTSDLGLFQVSSGELQTGTIQDVLDLVPSGGGTVTNNLLINSNFRIWQRFSKVLNVVNRRRISNLAILDVGSLLTDVVHGYKDHDIVQVFNMSDTSYNNSGADVSDILSTRFGYSNVGPNEALTAETTGKCIAISTESIVCNSGDFFADRWYSIRENGYSAVRRYIDDGVEIVSTTPSKFAIIQIISAEETKEYLGQSLSFSIDVSATVTSKVTASILGWFGTADAPTRDLVDTWEAAGVDPVLKTNWGALGTSTPVNLTTGYQTITLENIGSYSPVNLAIMIWCDSYTGYQKLFSFREAQLIQSETAQPYKRTNYLDELTNCLRFYQKSYNINTPPYAITDVGKHVFPSSFGTDSGGHYGSIPLAQMYKTPVVTLLTAAEPPTSGKWRVSSGSDRVVASDFVSNSRFAVKNDAGFTVSSISIAGHYTADAEI